VAVNKNQFNKNLSKSTLAFQELAKRQDEQSQLIVKWIASNSDMWDSMSEIQKLQLISTETLNKDLNKGVEKWNSMVDLAKDFNSTAVSTSEAIQDQVRSGTAMHSVAKSLVGREDEYNKLLQIGTKFSKSKAAIMANTVDRSRELAGNMLSIGTSEFISLDLNRDIAKAKAYGNDKDVDRLRILQEQQDLMKGIHTQIDETAKLLEQPFTAIDDWIKQIPIFGGLLSSLMPFEDWGKKISDSFREGASEAAREEFTGLDDATRKSNQEARNQQQMSDMEAKQKVWIDNDFIKNEIGQWEKKTEEEMAEITEAMGGLARPTSATIDEMSAGNVYGAPDDLTSDNLTIAGNVTMYVNGNLTTTGGVVESATGGTDIAGANMMNFDEWNKSIGNATIAAQQSIHAHRGYEEYMEGFAQPNIATEALPVDAMGTMAENIARLTDAGTTPGSIHTHVGNFDELINKIKGLIPTIAAAMKGKGGGAGGVGGLGGNGGGPEDKSGDAKPNGDASDGPKGPIAQEKAKVMEKISGWSTKIGEKWAEMGKLGKGIAIGIGLMVVGALKLLKTANELGVSFGSIPTAALIAKEEAQGLLDNFGTLEGVSNKTLLNMKWMAFWNGVQADDMAKIAALQVATSDLDIESSIEEQSKWMKQIKKEGLSASKIMADMASNSDFFALHMREGGKNIREAAKHMASLGLSLSEAEAITESLLDWETSINAEMETSVILGRSINLDRARRLAYDDKITEAMEEVKRQAGGEAEFAKMTSTQRKQLGETIGLQGATLAKFMQTEKQKEAATAAAAEEKRKEWAAYGRAAGAVIGMIAFGLASAVTLGLGGVGAGLKALAMMGLGAGLGYAAGGKVGAMAAGDVMGEAGKTTKIATKEGQFRELSPNDDWAAAPNLLETMASLRNQQPIVVQADNTGTEQKLEQLIALTNQSLTDREEQARKQRNATLDISRSS